jgi:hypothetical protein
MTATWPSAGLDALGRDVAPHGLGNFVPQLADDFPGYDFGTQRTSNGVSLVAVCRGGAAQPGTYVVVTSDPGEMRDALTSEMKRGSRRPDVPAERKQ